MNFITKYQKKLRYVKYANYKFTLQNCQISFMIRLKKLANIYKK